MAKKSNKKKSTKKNTSLLSIAIVVLCLLLILIVFLVKKDQILSNFKETHFFDRVFGSTPEFVENHEVKQKPDSNESVNDTITLNLLSEKKTEKSTPKETAANKPQESAPVVTPKAEEKKVENESSKTEVKTQTNNTKTEEKKTAEVKKDPAPAGKTDLQICFVYIDPDGSVLRKVVKKSVPKSDSPLTTAINVLLKGPDSTKADEKNCMSLIPNGTKLLSAKVQGGVAYLSFNEDFLVNEYGVDGYHNQLMQVVYTATAFSTVNSVQFLIEGEKIPYLSEGIWIGSPLSRGSF